MLDELRWTVATAAEHEALGRGVAPPDLLSPREHALVAAMRFPARRRKWLLGRWAAKRLLCQALAERGAVVAPARITVANEPSGAPFAELDGEGRLPWTLSLSQRDDLAYAALAPVDAPAVGVDIELVVPRDRALVRTFFTAEEADEVAACSGRDEHVAVARIWSAKEAVLKAMKLGLRLDTRRVRVRSTAESVGDGWRRLAVQVRDDVGELLELEAAWRDEGRYVLTAAAATPASAAALAALARQVAHGAGIETTTGR